MNEIQSERSALRRRIKAQRRALTRGQQRLADRQLTAQAARIHLLRPRLRVAFYSPTRGEAPISGLAELARQLRCELYLPFIVSHRANRMMFVRWQRNTPMRTHRWGFDQPVSRQHTPLRSLDLVFVPAVAVDERGVRVGAGAGFYDRALHFRRHSMWRRPKLIALVYDFQRVPTLHAQPWDVPVDAILSESGLHQCSIPMTR